MKLSTRKIERLANALIFFNDNHKLHGTVRMAMAQNVHRMAEVLDAYQKARNAIGHSIVGATPERIAAAEQEHQQLLDGVHDVNLIRLKMEQINADENRLPVHILSALMPIMRDADADALPPVDAPANDAEAAAPSVH